MVAIVLTPEQFRAAPREVREWLRGVIEADFGPDPRAAPAERPHPASVGLAAVTLPEAARMFEQLGGDFLGCQLLFELGRDHGPALGRVGQLHRIPISELMRNARLHEPNQLVARLTALNELFRRVRNDPSANLFAFDERGNCYVHEVTHESVAQLWREVVDAGLRSAPVSPAIVPGAVPTVGPAMPLPGTDTNPAAA